ncbi:hypothetical protein SANA_09860 [Gottschalkiaceae bacterium SANA]|nr:hypothetical protein SANA_09860 [Gottschalkiaceae bacterium SANA]
MWVPYLLSIIIIAITIFESIYAFEEAKKREYIKRGFDDPPPPPKRILRVIVIVIFLVYCLTLEISGHVASVCIILFSVVEWLISWKRFKRYKTFGDLIASTMMIILVSLFAYRLWGLFSM